MIYCYSSSFFHNFLSTLILLRFGFENGIQPDHGLPKVPDFSGPITPLELTTWLKECESVYDKENDNRKDGDPDCSENTNFPSDVPKIKAAGSALLEPSLANWWRAERSDFLEKEATWDNFVDALKCKALGRLWRAHALKTFYTLQQNDASLDDYLAAMADARYILNHGDEVIDDEQYKSLLLFRASPSLSEKVFAEQGFDWNKARPKDIRTKLRHVADENDSLPASRLVLSINFTFKTNSFGF